MALWHMFSFGSGYDDVLIRKGKRNARDTMEYGVLSMLLSNRPVDCHFMKNFSMLDLQVFFDLDPSEEQQLTPGITVSRMGGPLLPLCQLIRTTMTETGKILDDLGHRDIGTFILSVLSKAKAAGKPTSASLLIEELVNTFPTFDDRSCHNGQQVVFARKAQRLVGDLYESFHHENELFQFQDIDLITVDSGNFSVAMLCHYGILKLPDDLTVRIALQQEIEPGQMETALRAATIKAGRIIAEASGGLFSAREFGCYTVFMAQNRDALNGVRPHLTTGIVSY